MSDPARTPIAVSKATFRKLHYRALREGITIAELVERLINALIEDEARFS